METLSSTYLYGVAKQASYHPDRLSFVFSVPLTEQPELFTSSTLNQSPRLQRTSRHDSDCMLIHQ